MAEQIEDLNKIDASPTKDFFISILVRDIKLIDAVSDLVDNCVDGARRLRPAGNFQGLHISIEALPQHFIISDNCGGIPASIAREYAFRFGRPRDAQNTPHSIGQFGVGMKRALFKLGENFEIETKSAESRFKLLIDVNRWKNTNNVDEHGREIWEFEFNELEENIQIPENQCGTIITITQLHQNISSEFGLENFITRLITNIENAHQRTIENGLEIVVNDINLRHRFSTLLASERLVPYLQTETIQVLNSLVTIKIYVGISDAILSEAGWYIFCNDRLVLRADKSQETGWDQEVNQITIPKPHYQFARFRGYVYFDSDDASVLPWNTTKNGVDLESGLFQRARLGMIGAMRQVIDFLNDLDAELNTESEVLGSVVRAAQPHRISQLEVTQSFVYPRVNEQQPEGPRDRRISYTIPITSFEVAKELLKVNSAREVGEQTFSYFLRSMGKD